MDSRGVTLIELLIGLLAGIVVLAGISSVFVYSERVAYSSESQTFLQRQGALAMDQMTRRIISASALTRSVCNGNVNSIGVTNTVFLDPDGVARTPYCFYPSGNDLLMDTRAGTPQQGTWKLVSDTAARLTLTNFVTTLNGPRVTISFQISDNRQNSMTFSTDITRRN
jgi:Tfp pilus assembly protein PilW